MTLPHNSTNQQSGHGSPPPPSLPSAILSGMLENVNEEAIPQKEQDDEAPPSIVEASPSVSTTSSITTFNMDADMGVSVTRMEIDNRITAGNLPVVPSRARRCTVLIIFPLWFFGSMGSIALGVSSGNSRLMAFWLSVAYIMGVFFPIFYLLRICYRHNPEQTKSCVVWCGKAMVSTVLALGAILLALLTVFLWFSIIDRCCPHMDMLLPCSNKCTYMVLLGGVAQSFLGGLGKAYFARYHKGENTRRGETTVRDGSSRLWLLLNLHSFLLHLFGVATTGIVIIFIENWWISPVVLLSLAAPKFGDWTLETCERHIPCCRNGGVAVPVPVAESEETPQN